MMITCYVAGIVKGLVEHDDAYRHFGSLLSFEHHFQEAAKCGFVDSDRNLTEKGREWYDKSNLRDLPDARSYFWDVEFSDDSGDEDE